MIPWEYWDIELYKWCPMDLGRLRAIDSRIVRFPFGQRNCQPLGRTPKITKLRSYRMIIIYSKEGILEIYIIIKGVENIPSI